MNSKQLQYALTLAHTRSFSQAAEKLHISQPALSKQILALENELGVRLFDRNTVPVELTPAGGDFIPRAREILYGQDQLLRSMSRYKSGEAGQLTIGITPFRSSYLISPVVKKLREQFPGIRVRLHEAGSEILRREAAEGKYDFAVVNLPVDDSILDVIPLESDRLVLAVPRALENRLPPCTGPLQVDFADCRELPFVILGPTQEMRILFDKLCALSGFQPNIAVEAVSLTTAWTMACAGIAATILPMQFIRHRQLDDSLRIFSIRDTVYTRQPAVVTKRGQYISPAAACAISLLTNPTP